MNTPVSFKLAKLLNSKGLPGVGTFYNNEKHYRLNSKKYSIGDVVIWLYEKHGFWCYAYTNGKLWYPCIQYSSLGDMAVLSGKIGLFNSPTSAYEAAIEYTLNNLI